MNKYGYKILYKTFCKRKKLSNATNTFGLALFLILLHEKHKNKKREWYIGPVKTLREYEKLWKNCPFKDDFSNEQRSDL